MAAAAERPSAGGFVLWLHGSGGSGDESRAQVAPYFSAPDTASSVRLSFPTAPTASIPCYGERRSTCPTIQPAL
jgi:lysophospholipase-2